MVINTQYMVSIGDGKKITEYSLMHNIFKKKNILKLLTYTI